MQQHQYGHQIALDRPTAHQEAEYSNNNDKIQNNNIIKEKIEKKADDNNNQKEEESNTIEFNKTATDVQGSSTRVDKVRCNNPPLDNEH